MLWQLFSVQRMWRMPLQPSRCICFIFIEHNDIWLQSQQRNQTKSRGLPDQCNTSTMRPLVPAISSSYGEWIELLHSMNDDNDESPDALGKPAHSAEDSLYFWFCFLVGLSERNPSQNYYGPERSSVTKYEPQGGSLIYGQIKEKSLKQQMW